MKGRDSLKARALPPLWEGYDMNAAAWPGRRRELLHLLSLYEYGQTPPFEGEVQAFVRASGPAFAGKAERHEVLLSFQAANGLFTFPFQLYVPVGRGPVPAFVHLAFGPRVPDENLPAEEIIDHGFALANLCYTDVTSDSPQVDGLARAYTPEQGWGKLGMWAFAASRVMDYLLTRQDINAARIAVTGHSRLGKAALWCAAQDERFSLAVSNDSGCSGAALHRGSRGERIADITGTFPYWFCGAFRAYAGREEELPLDQHFLLALIAPRGLFISSATQDAWADPEAEYLGGLAATPAYELLGVPGLNVEELPRPDEPLLSGRVGYGLRTGTHFFSRSDWLMHMAFRERHGL